MQCKNRVLARESAWPLSQLGKWGCQAGQKQVQKWNLFFYSELLVALEGIWLGPCIVSPRCCPHSIWVTDGD